MAPATLHGYERLAVKWADFPAVVAVAAGVKSPDESGVGVGSAEDSPHGMGGEMEGGAHAGLARKRNVETVGGMVVFLTAGQRRRVDEEEGLLFELKPVTVEVLVLEPRAGGDGGAVGKVLVQAETYVWDGARASLWEKEEKVWTLEGSLADLAGWGMDGGGGVDVWGVDGMDAGGRVEGGGDADWGMLIPHERWFPEEGEQGAGEGSEVLYEGLFGLP